MRAGRQTRAIRAIALVLCACLVAVLVGSALFLAAHSHHHCTGPACRICCLLHQARQALKRLLAGGFFAAAALSFAAALVALPRCFTPVFAAATPVGTRVRLND